MTTTDENPNRRDWNSGDRHTWLIEEGLVQSCQLLIMDCYRETIKQGRYNDPETGEPINYSVLELMRLVIDKIADAAIADADGTMDKHLPHRLGLEVEIAEALIILFSACGYLGLDIGNAMAEKLEYNNT